jgi:hypothetical protein
MTNAETKELQVVAATTALANKAGGDPLDADTVKATVDKRVAQYIQVRDTLQARNKAHEEAIKPLIDIQNMLTGWMQSFLEQAGADSVKTSHGTCYSTTRYTASLADPEAFMNHVISTQSYDLLDRKANVTAVKDYVNEKGGLPPGVNLSSIKTVGVRRASGK